MVFTILLDKRFLICYINSSSVQELYEVNYSLTLEQSVFVSLINSL